MDLLNQLLKSKKFVAMIIGIIATFLSTRYGFDEVQTKEIIALVISYIVGQGIADHGKEAVKAQVEAARDE